MQGEAFFGAGDTASIGWRSEGAARIVATLAMTVALSLGTIASTSAANVNWLASPPSGVFTDPGNWVGGSPPAAEDLAVFAISDQTIITLETVPSVEVSGITFASDASDYSFIIGFEQALTLSGSGVSGNNGVHSFSLSTPSSAMTFTGAASAFVRGVDTSRITYSNAGSISFQDFSSAGFAQIENSGTVEFTASAAGGDAVIVNNSSGALVDLTTLTVSELTLAAIAGTGEIQLDDTALTVGTDDSYWSAFQSTEFSGVISGTGSLSKVASGTLTLTGENTFAGTTSIVEGTLSLGDGGISGAVAGDIDNQSTLLFNRSNNWTYGGVISGAGDVWQLGPGNVTLTGANTYTGLTTVSDGRLQLGTGGAIASDIFVSSNSNAWFDFKQAGEFTYASVLSGGQASQQGPGTTILTGANSNSYWGISGGTLRVGPGGTLAASNALIQMSGFPGFVATLDLGGSTQTIDTLRTFGGWESQVINGTVNAATLFDIQEGLISADLTGTATFIKSSADTTILSGTNTFTGGAGISDGVLEVRGGAAIEDGVSVSVAGDGIFRVTNSETIGGLLGDGDVELNQEALTLGGNGVNTLFDGTVTGLSESSIVKVGIGIWTVSGALDQATTFISEGEIQLNGTSSSEIYVESDGRLSGVGTISTTLSNLGVVAPGTSPGILTVSGNYVGGGILEAEVQFNNAASPVSGVTHDLLDIGGNASGTTAVSLVPFLPSDMPAPTSGNGIQLVRVGGAAAADAFTMSSYLIGSELYELVYLEDYSGSDDGFFLQSVAVSGCTVSTSDDACLIDAATNQAVEIDALAGFDTLQLTGTDDFDFDVSGIGTTYTNFEAFQKAGSSTVTLTGSTTLSTLGFEIQAGTLIAGTGQLGSLGVNRIFGTGVLQLAGDLTVGSIAGDGTIDLDSFFLQAGGNDASTEFSGNIIGTGDFQKQGTGTLRLSGANTNTGFMSVIGGVLEVAGGAAIDDASRVILDPAGTLRLINDETIGSLEGTLISGGAVELGANRLTLGGNGFSTLFGGVISGDGGLTKTGESTLTLTGTNTYEGPTAVTGGTLIAGSAAAFGAGGAMSVGGGGILDLAGFDMSFAALSGAGQLLLGDASLTLGGDGTATAFTGPISGTGKLIKSGSGIFTLSGDNDFSGGIDIMGGGISLASNTAAGTGPITTFSSIIDYANGVTIATPIVLASNDTQLRVLVGTATQSGAISEVGGVRPIEKIGVGNLTLSGANTYTGLTTITDGTLTLAGGAAIADAASVDVTSVGTLALAASETIATVTGTGALALGSGTVLSTGATGASWSFDGDSGGLGGWTKTGGGTLTLTGDNTFSGAFAVSGGQVTINGGGSLANASALSIASGATAVLGAAGVDLNGAGATASGLGAVTSSGALYLDDDSSIAGASLSLSASSSLGLFLTTNTTQYGTIAAGGVASVGGALTAHLDPISFAGATGTSYVYDDVVSGASRTGTFSSLSMTGPSSLFSIAAVYDATSVDLVLTRTSFTALPTLVPGGNGQSVCAAIEAIYASGGGSGDVAALIAGLFSLTPDQIAAACVSLGGGTAIDTIFEGLRADDPFKAMVADRLNGNQATGCRLSGAMWCYPQYAANGAVMNDASDEGDPFAWLRTGVRDPGAFSTWVRGIGSWGVSDPNRESAGSETQLGGVIAGADYVVTPTFMLGAAGQYTETNIDHAGPINEGQIASVQAGLYGSWGDSSFFINANLSGILHEFESQRAVATPLGARIARADYEGRSLSGAIEIGAIFDAEGVRVQPIAALSLLAQEIDAYEETGAGGLSLLVEAADTISLKSQLGARLARPFSIGGIRMVPEGRVSWVHEFLDTRQVLTAAFADAPNVDFGLGSRGMTRDTAVLGAGLTVPAGDNTTFFLDYDGAISARSRGDSLAAGVRVTW